MDNNAYSTVAYTVSQLVLFQEVLELVQQKVQQLSMSTQTQTLSITLLCNPYHVAFLYLSFLLEAICSISYKHHIFTQPYLRLKERSCSPHHLFLFISQIPSRRLPFTTHWPELGHNSTPTPCQQRYNEINQTQTQESGKCAIFPRYIVA